jgi:hypothetical protein
MYLIYVADGESKRLITLCNRIYGFRNDASGMLSGYIQEYLGMEISLFGCFGNYSRINLLLIFQPILEKIRHLILPFKVVSK